MHDALLFKWFATHVCSPNLKWKCCKIAHHSRFEANYATLVNYSRYKFVKLAFCTCRVKYSCDGDFTDSWAEHTLSLHFLALIYCVYMKFRFCFVHTWIYNFLYLIMLKCLFVTDIKLHVMLLVKNLDLALSKWYNLCISFHECSYKITLIPKIVLR